MSNNPTTPSPVTGTGGPAMPPNAPPITPLGPPTGAPSKPPILSSSAAQPISSGPPPPQKPSAPPQRATPAWVQRLLRSVYKLETLSEVQKRAKFLTPFEMRALIDPEEVGLAVEDRLGNFARLLEAFRNVGVLLPIVITWFSLSAASDAYQQSLAKDKTLTTVPFLQLWQTGFPLVNAVTVGPWHNIVITHGKEHFFTFGGFAFVDAIILGLLLLLTLLGQMLTTWAYWRGKALYHWLNRELLDLCKGSSLWAIGPNAQRASDELSQMQVALAQMVQAASEQTSAVTKLQANMQTVHDAAEKMGDNAQMLSDSTEPAKEWMAALARDTEAMIELQSISEEQRQAILQILVNGADRNDPAVRRALEHRPTPRRGSTPRQPRIVRFFKRLFGR